MDTIATYELAVANTVSRCELSRTRRIWNSVDTTAQKDPVPKCVIYSLASQQPISRPLRQPEVATAQSEKLHCSISS
jgi:hypothetical protein